jgi:antitoxin HicB
MKSYAYPAIIKKSRDGTYGVQFVNFKEGFTFGNTLEEAQENASEVLSLLLESYLSLKKPLPTATSTKKAAKWILPDAKTQAAMALYDSLGTSKNVKTMAQLARAMDTSWAAASRLGDPSHWPTLKLLDKAVRATGKRLVISVE